MSSNSATPQLTLSRETLRYAKISATYSTKLLGLVVMLPFMQLGLSYYLSVQIAAAVVGATNIPFRVYANAFGFKGAVWVAILLLLSPFLQPTADLQQAILWSARIFLCFLVVYAALIWKEAPRIESIWIERALAVVTAGLLIFSLVQRAAYLSGTTLNLPLEWYVANEENIATELDVLHGYSRASATFGEPSYLAFILFSLYFVVLFRARTGWYRQLMITALWAAVLSSGSFSGLLSFSLLSLAMLVHRSRKSMVRLVGYAVALMIAAALVIPIIDSLDLIPDQLVTRIGAVLEGNVDDSTESRLLLAWRLAEYSITTYPLGAQLDVLQSDLGQGAIFGTDNGFLLLVANCGVAALLMYALICFRLRRDLILGLYLLCASMFSGSVFSYDKVAVAVLVILLTSQFRKDIARH